MYVLSLYDPSELKLVRVEIHDAYYLGLELLVQSSVGEMWHHIVSIFTTRRPPQSGRKENNQYLTSYNEQIFAGQTIKHPQISTLGSPLSSWQIRNRHILDSS